MKKVSKRVFAYVLVISLFFSNDYFNVFAKEIKKEGINKEKIEETISENMIDIETDSENEISELGDDSEDEYKPKLPAGDTIDTDKGSILWNISESGLLIVVGKGQPELTKKRIQYVEKKGETYERHSYTIDYCWPWAEYQNVITSAAINISDFTTCENMFLECPYLEEVTFGEKFDTSNVTDMYSMFSGCKSLTKLDLSKINTSKVTNMYGMFSDCSSLTELDLSNMNTSNVTNMRYMFLDCSSLTKLDLSNFDTSKVTNMCGMFSDCSSLTELKLGNINTSNVTNMRYMFSDCSSLTELKLGNINTSNVTDMDGIFSGCKSILKLDLSNFDTSKLLSMDSIFSGCSSLLEVDLSKINTSNVTNMYGMFSECSSLLKLDLSNFDTSKLNDMRYLFSGCSSLLELDLSKINTSEVTNMDSMFSGCKSLVEVDLSKIDTSKVTNMAGMFSGCSSLLEVDLSKIDTSKVTNMAGMFSGCSSLFEVDLSKINTSNVTNMHSMFSGCSSLLELDLSKINTSKVTNMDSMFMNCTSLFEIELNKMNTSKVTNMSSMFLGCSSLEGLDLSSFDTSNLTNMEEMFYNCKSLKELDLSSFDAPNLTNMEEMFYNCESLKELDLSSFNTSNVISMGKLFYNCKSLEELDLSNFNTSKVTDMNGMFRGCSLLRQLDLSSFNTLNVEYINAMFSGDKSLKRVDLSNFDLSNIFYCVDFFNDTGLELIISPINLPKSRTIIISNNSEDKWIDENGNIITTLPKGLTSPIVIQKNVEDAPEPYKEINVETIVSEGNGKIIPGSCSYDLRFPRNFKFIPDKGYCVNKVIIDGENKGSISSYKFTSENSKGDTHTIEVYFIQKYTVNIKNDNYVKITGNLEAAVNEDILLSFKAKDGYRITDVLVDGKSVGAVDSYKFEKIIQNHEIEFKVAKENLIKVICGENGKISPKENCTVLEGESITYTITPNEKYIIKDVLVDEESIGAVKEYTFENVTTNHSIEASFIRNVFNVSFNVNGKNIDSFSKEVINGNKYGNLPTVSENGIIFSGWYTAKSGGNKITEETVVSLTSDITLYAHFDYINIVEKQKLDVKKYFTDVENIKSYKVIKLDNAKASVNKKGKLKASKAGMIKVVPCVKEGKKKVQLDDKAITIIITKPMFKTKSITGSVGETKSINSLITGLPANSNEITYTIKASKNPAKQVAKINEETGNIELLAKGKTKLTVHIVNDDKSERKLTIKIKVK